MSNARRRGPSVLLAFLGMVVLAGACAREVSGQTAPTRHHHAVTGAVVGGLAAGVIVGQDMLRKPSQCRGSGNYGQTCALILGGSVVAGALVGATVGYFVRHDDRVAVSVTPPMAIAGSRTIGPGVSVALRFALP